MFFTHSRINKYEKYISRLNLVLCQQFLKVNKQIMKTVAASHGLTLLQTTWYTQLPWENSFHDNIFMQTVFVSAIFLGEWTNYENSCSISQFNFATDVHGIHNFRERILYMTTFLCRLCFVSAIFLGEWTNYENSCSVSRFNFATDYMVYTTSVREFFSWQHFYADCVCVSNFSRWMNKLWKQLQCQMV